MFCTRCRKKLSDDASFCTCCGQPTSSSPKATDTVDLKTLLYGPLLTVITVLLTVMTAVELVNFNFYAILFIPLVVGMWLIFSGVFAKSDKLFTNGIAVCSITVRIQYIINYVIACLTAVLGIIVSVILSDFGVGFTNDIVNFDTGIESIDGLYGLFGFFTGTMTIAVAFLMLVSTLGIIAILILFNTLFLRRILKFLSGISGAIKENKNIATQTKSISGVLITLGIIYAVIGIGFAIIGFILNFVSLWCTAAVCIISSVMVKKIFR